MYCNRRLNDQVSSFFSTLLSATYCLLIFSCCLLVSCGKKGDPTLKSYEKPDAPSGMVVIHRESEIIIQWQFPRDKEKGLRGFHVMKSLGGDYEKLAFLEDTVRSLTDTDFQTELTYRYKIVSESLKGITNESVTLSITPENPPAPPSGLSFNVRHDSLTLSWKSEGQDIMYNVYKSYEKGVNALNPLHESPLTNTFFEDSFDIRKSVYYTVRSLLGGNQRDEGPPSEELTVDPLTFIPSSPEALQAVPTDEKVYLIWKEPPETWVSSYRVYREIDPGEGFLLLGETRTPSFIDKDRPSAQRSYRVTAVGPSKEGPPAEIRNVVFKKQE